MVWCMSKYVDRDTWQLPHVFRSIVGQNGKIDTFDLDQRNKFLIDISTQY